MSCNRDDMLDPMAAFESHGHGTSSFSISVPPASAIADAGTAAFTITPNALGQVKFLRSRTWLVVRCFLAVLGVLANIAQLAPFVNRLLGR
jgi:hypothetical protein